MCTDDQNLTPRQVWLDQLRAAPDGKIVRKEDGVTITDFDPDRAPPAPKGNVAPTAPTAPDDPEPEEQAAA
jgi:hypothetical protein